MIKYVSNENFIKYLKVLFGSENVYNFGVERTYNKGDIMKYKNGDNYSFYRCKKQGIYSLPDAENFKKVLL